MHPWDALGGLLLAREAGYRVAPYGHGGWPGIGGITASDTSSLSGITERVEPAQVPIGRQRREPRERFVRAFHI